MEDTPFLATGILNHFRSSAPSLELEDINTNSFASNNSDNTSLAAASTLGSLEDSAHNLEPEDSNIGGVLLARDSLGSLVDSTPNPVSRSFNIKKGSSIPSNSLVLLNYIILSTTFSFIYTIFDVYNSEGLVDKDYIVMR